jgi:hypothetical protein
MTRESSAVWKPSLAGIDGAQESIYTEKHSCAASNLDTTS